MASDPVALDWWSAPGRPALSSRDRLTLLARGFMAYHLAIFLDLLGLQCVSVGLERLMLYLYPTLVLLLLAVEREWLLGGAFTPGLAAGTTCVLVGVWMLTRSR